MTGADRVIDYYFSPVSSYSYLAGLRLETIAARHGARISYRPLDIVALFSRTGGKVVADRHPSRQSYRAEDLARLAAREGLPFILRPRHLGTDPTLAALTIIAAARTGGSNIGILVHGLMRAFWGEGQDIADPDVIRSLLHRHGFDPDLASQDLGWAAAILGENLDDAVRTGVFGAPTYVMGGKRFWGQDRLTFLDDCLARP